MNWRNITLLTRCFKTPKAFHSSDYPNLGNGFGDTNSIRKSSNALSSGIPSKERCDPEAKLSLQNNIKLY